MTEREKWERQEHWKETEIRIKRRGNLKIHFLLHQKKISIVSNLFCCGLTRPPLRILNLSLYLNFRICVLKATPIFIVCEKKNIVDITTFANLLQMENDKKKKEKKKSSLRYANTLSCSLLLPQNIHMDEETYRQVRVRLLKNLRTIKLSAAVVLSIYLSDLWIKESNPSQFVRFAAAFRKRETTL